MGTDQLVVLAAGAAAAAGATVSDDPVLDVGELPGAREVARLQPIDPDLGLQGIQKARAQLEQPQ